tara:strand:+ start:1316 stop:3433 length:2118 start_codon:yes stop_codon:yes gene_type:complete
MAPTKKRLPEPPTDDTVISNAALQFDEDDFDDDDFDEDTPKPRRGDFDDEDEAMGLNDPDIEHLGDSPIIGGGGGRQEDMYGSSAEYAMGRSMSPRLYSQAAQFPTCSQLRVWKWENGIPVGLGAIDATATEEDLVRRFGSAMPKKGEGRGQFKLRPIDIRGQELGQEVTLVISEHHAAIQALRDREAEERLTGGQGGVHVVQGPGGGEAYGEMGRMFEHALEAAESRTNVLESALERERERIRQEDVQRAQERVDLATNAAQGVQALTERMMSDESGRAERAMNMQNQQSQTLVTTLSSIFSQQQGMMQQSTDQQRRADEFRLEQERQRADRERRDAEDRMRLQQQEWERKRSSEREEADHKLKMEREEAQRRFEQHRMELDAKLQREREDMERKERKERDDAERRDRWLAEERTRREERIGREQSEREAERNRQHERMLKDGETSAQRDREHAERMMQLSKIEMENKASAGGMNVLGNAAGMLKQFGIEPNQILPKLFSPDEDEEKGGGWLDALPSILGAAAEMAKARVAPPEAQPQIGMMQRPALPDPRMDPRMYAGDPFMAEAQPSPEMFQAPPPMPDSPPPMDSEVAEDDPVEESPKQKQTRELSTMAAEAGLPLRAQKNARVELRTLVRKLRDADASTWQDHILASLSTELSIYHYVQAVTVRAALSEAGADGELTDSVCAAMQQSSVVPPDLRYDWGT